MKKRLNNKGFTLVELLATVVILLAISTVAITSISASIDRQNEKKDKATEALIVSYARIYIEERINQGINCVKLGDLVSAYGLDKKSLMMRGKEPNDNSSVVYSSGSGSYTYYETNQCG